MCVIWDHFLRLRAEGRRISVTQALLGGIRWIHPSRLNRKHSRGSAYCQTGFEHTYTRYPPSSWWILLLDFQTSDSESEQMPPLITQESHTLKWSSQNSEIASFWVNSFSFLFLSWGALISKYTTWQHAAHVWTGLSPETGLGVFVGKNDTIHHYYSFNHCHTITWCLYLTPYGIIAIYVWLYMCFHQ